MPQWTVWTTELCVSRACVRACVHVRVRVPPWCYLSFQYQVFPLPVLEHLEGLQGTDDIHWVHSCFLADLCKAHNKKNNPCMLSYGAFDLVAKKR